MAEALARFRALWKPSDPGFLPGLSVLERAVLSALLVHQNRQGRSWPSQDTLAKATKSGRSTVNRALDDLERKGLISRVAKPGYTTRYAVVFPDSPGARQSQSGTVPERDSPGARQSRSETVPERDSPGVRQSRSETETVPERDSDRPGERHELPKELPNELPNELGGDQEEEDPFPPLSALPRERGAIEYPQAFESAWANFPRRAGSNPKTRAYRAWRARVVEEAVNPDELLKGVDRYARFAKTTGKLDTEYILQAATFFGPDERWREPWEAPKSENGAPPTQVLR